MEPSHHSFYQNQKRNRVPSAPPPQPPHFFPLLGVQEELGLVESPGQQSTRATSKISNLTVAILIDQPALPTPVAKLGFPGL